MITVLETRYTRCGTINIADLARQGVEVQAGAAVRAGRAPPAQGVPEERQLYAVL